MMKKRILAFLLAAIMIVSLLPVTAFANNTTLTKGIVVTADGVYTGGIVDGASYTSGDKLTNLDSYGISFTKASDVDPVKVTFNGVDISVSKLSDAFNTNISLEGDKSTFYAALCFLVPTELTLVGTNSVMCSAKADKNPDAETDRKIINGLYAFDDLKITANSAATLDIDTSSGTGYNNIAFFGRSGVEVGENVTLKAVAGEGYHWSYGIYMKGTTVTNRGKLIATSSQSQYFSIGMFQGSDGSCLNYGTMELTGGNISDPVSKAPESEGCYLYNLENWGTITATAAASEMSAVGSVGVDVANYIENASTGTITATADDAPDHSKGINSGSITNAGTMTGTAGTSSGGAYGIYSKGAVTNTDGKMTGIGTMAAYSLNGIYVTSELNVEGGIVEGTGIYAKGYIKPEGIGVSGGAGDGIDITYVKASMDSIYQRVADKLVTITDAHLLNNGESCTIKTTQSYTVKNTTPTGTSTVIEVTEKKDNSDALTGAGIVVPSGATFSVAPASGTSVSYTANGTLTSTYVADSSGNVKLSDAESGEANPGVKLVLTKGNVTLDPVETVYTDSDKVILNSNASGTITPAIVTGTGNVGDTNIPLSNGQKVTVGAKLLNGVVQAPKGEYEAVGSATVSIDKSEDIYDAGTVKLTAGAIKLDADDMPIGITGASVKFFIDVPEAKPTATVTNGDGVCTVTIPASGEADITVGEKTYKYINNSAAAVTVSIKADGTLKTVLNNKTAPSNLPDGEYEAYTQRTSGNTTSYTFRDDLDEALTKANTAEGDTIVLNTKLTTNPTTSGYVLTTNKINIYTAQGNLAQNHVTRDTVDTAYGAAMTATSESSLYTVDSRERSQKYVGNQSVADNVTGCMVVKVSNETSEIGHVEIQSGEAKIKWSETDTTYYVTLADAIYDASHAANTGDGPVENQYNTHDGKNSTQTVGEGDKAHEEIVYNNQTIEMNINPYENRENLVLEAGDTLVIRGENNAVAGDTYVGVTRQEDGTYAPADVKISMYEGKNDVYVVSGTAKVTNNTDSTKGEADGAADAYVGAYNAGFYARTTAANDILYVTGGTTATYTANDAAYVTASKDAQKLEIGVGAGYVTYTVVDAGYELKITKVGKLDVNGEKVEIEEANITGDCTFYSEIIEAVEATKEAPAVEELSSKITVKDTDTTDGKITVTNAKDNKQVVITAAKAGEKVAVDPMGGSAQTEYTFAENNTTLTVKANAGANDSAYTYVTTLFTGAVQLDNGEAIFEPAADVKIVSTAEGKAITVKTASVNGADGVIVTAPEGGNFNVLDKDGVKTGLNGITVKAETKFFVDGTGYITLLNGKIEVAGNADSFINLGTNDEKISGVDGTLTVEAVRTSGGEPATFENGVTTGYVTLPAGKQATFDNGKGDKQTYTNPTKKPDGNGNDTSNTIIAILPTAEAQRVVVGGDIELDKNESIYVTDAAYLKATDSAVNTPVAAALTLVTNSGDTKVQVAYGNSDAQNLHNPDPYNTVSIPEGGEATFTIGENARKVAVQEDGNDLVNSMLEAAVLPSADEKEIVVSFPPLDYLYRAVCVDGNTGITYTNKDTTKATLLGITKDGTVYAKKGSASTEEGDILLDPSESVNVKLSTGFAKVENTAAQDSKKVTVGKEIEGKNPVTVPKGGSVKIEGAAFSTEKMSANTVFDIVKDGGDILATIPAGESLSIDGKDYKAIETAAIKVSPAEKRDDMTKNEIVLLNGALEIIADGAVTNTLPVENKGAQVISVTNDTNDTITIPANNTVVINGVEIKPESNVTATVVDSPASITLSIPAGSRITVDGVVYTNTTDGDATLTINAVTGLPTTDSNVFNSFDVEVPNGLKAAATVTLPSGKTIDRDAQTFTVPDGKSITLGDRTYTAVDGEIVVDANASGIAVWIDPVVTVKAKVTVTENKQLSKNPDNETEKAINTYESKTDGTAAVAVFSGKRDEVAVSAGTLALTASNVWHTVTFSGVTGIDPVTTIWSTDINNVLPDADPEKADAFFAGWYYDGFYTKSVNKSTDKLLADTTVYAKWVQKTGTVTGTVNNDAETPSSVSGASVKLMKGNTQWGEAVQTDANGVFTFENVPAGTYQIVVTKDEATTTALVVINAAGKVTVDGAETATMSLSISGDKKANSSVEITGNTPDVAVGGLDAIAKEAAKTIDPGQTVTVNMSIESQIKVATNEEQIDIQKEAEGRTVEYISIDIFKTIRTTADGTLVGQENVPVKETEGLITVVVPFQTSGRSNFIIIRSHEGEDSVKVIDKLTTKANADGEYIVVGAGEITMFVKKFSTYSIGYNTNGSDIGGNIGGGGSTKNEVELPTDLANGKVEVSPKSAAKGSTVTLTVTPDKGFTLETLTVLDKNGKQVEVKNLGNGKYSFKMPSGKVSISATFAETPEEEPPVEETPVDEPEFVNPFTDIAETDYFYDAVLWAAENGITKGTDDVHFSPDMGTTRAQVVTFLWRAAGEPEPTGDASKFVDVPANEYYAKAVAWAIEQGITKGTSSTTFTPDAVCTRGQIVTFLARFAGVEDADTASAFADVKSTDYFAAAVKWAKDNKVTEGTSATTFSPNTDCTRAQVVTFLYRWMVR